MNWFGRLFRSPEPRFAETRPSDASEIARLHASAFRRGWSEDEVERLLLDRSVIGHRANVGPAFAGFILSRMAADEAEILSVAVARPHAGKGVARALLALHLRRLAGLGVAKVFLEVEEANTPARRLYARAGFAGVGRRPGYYPQTSGAASAAIVLRRDL